MTIDLPFQIEFIVNLTFRCNLRCKMCTQYGENYKEQAMDEIDIEDWVVFLDEIKDVNPKPKIILMGGEPFLYRYFSEFFNKAYSNGLKIHIVTNGYYLDKFIPLLEDCDINITVSIDGLFDTHDNIRGKKGLFEKVRENIELIDKLQKQGSKIKLRLNHVMLPENIDNIFEFYKFFNKYNIDTFTFQHIQSSDDKLNQITQKQWKERLNQDYCMGLIPKENYKLDKTFALKVKNSLDNFKNHCTENNCFAFPALEDDELEDYYTNNNLDNLRKNMICTIPWTTPTINPNGDVSNCISNIIGNIKKESFWDIWNNEKAQNLRDSLVRYGKYTICTKCCNFYKGNFICAPNCKIEINNIKMRLPDELNYIQSTKKVAFIKERNSKKEDEYIPAQAVNIHSKQMLDMIKKTNEVITITD